MSNNNELIVVDQKMLKATDTIRVAITEKHKKVSRIATPKPFIKKKAFVVQGRLSWYDEGIWRKADMVAAHRIQKKRGTNEFVDIGNDVKASNTDCIKKAFNMYLNIADDVYRNQVEDLELSDEQKNEILILAGDVSEERMEQVHDLIKEQAVNTANFNSSMRKLDRELLIKVGKETEKKNENTK